MSEEQLEIGFTGYVSPEKPPTCRAECASIERPCNRYGCIHHAYPQTERAGRPHRGKHNEVTLVEREDSCVLDVAEKGMTPRPVVGKKLGITKERVRQLEDRAMRKIGVALGIESSVEELRSKLYGKAVITTAYPRTRDPNRVCIVVVVATLDQQGQVLEVPDEDVEEPRATPLVRIRKRVP